jgi:hypothetical protein
MGVSGILAPDETANSESPAISSRIEAALMSAEVAEEQMMGSGEWYPTLQKTINLLSKVYGCIPVMITHLS